MSIKIQSRIWETSPSKGVELLIELALGDYCDDSGRCWPATASVALKARCTERYVQATIKQRVAEGRLKVEPQAGPKGTNVYTFLWDEHSSPRTQFTPNSDAGGGELCVSQSSPEPSAPVIDPSPSLQKGKPREKSVTEADVERLKQDFPSLDVNREWAKAQDWLRETGRVKKDNLAFLRNWLRRAEDEPRSPSPRHDAKRSERVAAPTGRDRAAEARRILAR